jgi:endonuclease I
MRVHPLFIGAHFILLSRKKSREFIKRLYPTDIYTGRALRTGVWTLEHVVPQSRISSPGRKHDLHNLGGLHTRINSRRGNKAFGDPANFKDLYGCQVSPNLFSPARGKGEVARKCAYMLEQYGELIDMPSVMSQETMLKWNDMFPPCDDEKRRNELIHEVQGSFNKFVEDAHAVTKLASCLK